ncbi:hypothetical protein CC80DRAFT_489231 [Byssothecium circinans]|uniref:Uncharacterized protein n=1 Tax=Byssothecium circinans TaxID=147558 RepID=A0A6A5U9L0_9PLEO|nr:hypothetical protein CC80DRAFT_489231 [Byssothecium circinans]
MRILGLYVLVVLQPLVSLKTASISFTRQPPRCAMEALAAVALAGNVVQFVDFTFKLFDQARSIHQSQTGTSKGTDSLESITLDLQNLSAQLSKDRLHLRIRKTYAFHQSHKALQQLATQCHDAAAELLSALEVLKAKNPNSKWSSFRAALASTWKRSQIDGMERTLDGYRSQIILHLQKLQDEKISCFLSLMDDLSYRSRRANANMLNQISGLREDVHSALKIMNENLAAQSAWKSQRPPHSMRCLPSGTQTVDISTLTQTLVQSEALVKNLAISLALLAQLRFEQMDFRRSKIREAYPTTFENVFDSRIVPWLHSSEPIFWISGKPGSGKSTLMKYVIDNPGTLTELRKSTDGCEPKIASYYFWVNGTEIQRSQEGLLRSLLYELLRWRSDLVEIAFPDTWKDAAPVVVSNMPFHVEWTRSELNEAFERLALSGVADTRFCVFIDGLDEYGGDHDELLGTIAHLKAMKIKLCVASRPWNVFEEAFGQDSRLKLYLQDLNGPDIEIYVNNKLRARPDFLNLYVRMPEAEDLTNEIVLKSQGVFLWVYLAVRSLIEGLRNHDQLSQLRKRLKDFPSDLEEFFGHIFASIEHTYRQKTAHVFEFALHSDSTRSPLTYWYLDEVEDDPDFALKMPILQLAPEELNNRVEHMKIRINGRCKGLLEVTDSKASFVGPDPRVDFLHRTVTDFFMTTDIRRTFSEWQDPDFDPELAICKASLAELKAIVKMNRQEAPPLSVPIQSIFSAAAKLESRNLVSASPYIDQLEAVGNQADRIAEDESYPWNLCSCTGFMDVALNRYELYLFLRHGRQSRAFPSARWKLMRAEFEDSLERKCAVLSCRPVAKLHSTVSARMTRGRTTSTPTTSATTISQLSDAIKEADPTIVYENVKIVFENCWFTMESNGQFSELLDASLRCVLGDAEMAELYRLNELCQERDEGRAERVDHREVVDVDKQVRRNKDRVERVDYREVVDVGKHVKRSKGRVERADYREVGDFDKQVKRNKGRAERVDYREVIDVDKHVRRSKGRAERADYREVVDVDKQVKGNKGRAERVDYRGIVDVDMQVKRRNRKRSLLRRLFC